MKIYEIYFSPTGGTKKVTDMIGRSWDGQKEEIDLSNDTTDFSAYHFQEQDVCIIAVPSFGGRVPQVALARIGAMTGGGAKAILVAVYGNREIDDTLLELKITSVSSGFTCIAAIQAVAEHSIMRQFGKGRPDAQDEQELKSFGIQIKEAIEQNSLKSEVQVPGKMPYREYNGVPFKPIGGKKCTGCGLCAEKCPVHAIPKENPAATDKDKCISCMRCVSVCPRNARDLSKIMLFVASSKMKKACGGRKQNKLYL